VSEKQSPDSIGYGTEKTRTFLEDQSQFPEWISKLHERKITDTIFHNDTTIGIIFFHPLTDSTSYCIYAIMDGISSTIMLATQKNKKPFKEMEIGNETDTDLSWTYSSSTIYEHDSIKGIIKSIEYSETAEPAYLVKDENGVERYKEGYNLENVPTIKDSVITRIKIDSTGNLIVIKNDRR
jgi:hypothetical protein